MENIATLHTFATNWTASCRSWASYTMLMCRDESRFMDDNSLMTASGTFYFLRTWLYNARTDMKPLWNRIVVIGMEKDKP